MAVPARLHVDVAKNNDAPNFGLDAFKSQGFHFGSLVLGHIHMSQSILKAHTRNWFNPAIWVWQKTASDKIPQSSLSLFFQFCCLQDTTSTCNAVWQHS